MLMKHWLSVSKGLVLDIFYSVMTLTWVAWSVDKPCLDARGDFFKHLIINKLLINKKPVKTLIPRVITVNI